MEKKPDRCKVNEREQFSYEYKQKILAKSDDRCCHCGRKAYIGYGATVDHYVPISKGGINDDCNLVMLCETCNKEKDDLIIDPDNYLVYLKEPYKSQLLEWFDRFIQSYEFVNRKNLLACDQYTVFVIPDAGAHKLKKGAREIRVPHALKRAAMTDIPRLNEYFIKYLKKYDCLDDEVAAKANVLFWLQFGSIYYVEKNGEIKVMAAATIKDVAGSYVSGVDRALSLSIFSYYSTGYAYTLASGIMRSIPRFIVREQELPQLPICVNVLKNDPLSYRLIRRECYNDCDDEIDISDGRFCRAYVLDRHPDYYGREDELAMPMEDEKLKVFFSKFQNVEEKMTAWFAAHEEAGVDWMRREISVYQSNEEYLEDTEIIKDFEECLGDEMDKILRYQEIIDLLNA